MEVTADLVRLAVFKVIATGAAVILMQSAVPPAQSGAVQTDTDVTYEERSVKERGWMRSSNPPKLNLEEKIRNFHNSSNIFIRTVMKVANFLAFFYLFD